VDFVHDQLTDGRRLRMLTLVDNFSRVSPVIEVDRSLRGRHVVAVLNRLKATRGVPKIISVDNGPEFTGRVLEQWAYQNGVELDFSRPGTPTDNPFIESFNGKLRMECLNGQWFTDLEDARRHIETWRTEYNTYRPHSSLGGMTPAAYEAEFYHRGTASQRTG
jgi:putative transposase